MTLLEEAYAGAWDEWESSGEAALWDATAADGVVDLDSSPPTLTQP